MHASLPMYDFPEVRQATDGLWQHLAAALCDAGLAAVPEQLEHPHDWDVHWQRAPLLWTQVCGVEVVRRLRRRFRVVATPHYSAPGCVGGTYRSFVVVPQGSRRRTLEALRGATLVVNSHYSHSGCTSLVPLIAPLAARSAFFAQVQVSGSHEASLRVLQEGRADVAAIDCVTYALLARYRPAALRCLRIIAQTHAAPAPPFVTPLGCGNDEIARMQQAVVDVVTDPQTAALRDALLLRSIEPSNNAAYAPLSELLDAGEACGFVQLHQGYLPSAPIAAARALG